MYACSLNSCNSEKLLKEHMYEPTEMNERSFNEMATWVIKTRLASSSNFHPVAFYP